jgi:hypothetical protein
VITLEARVDGDKLRALLQGIEELRGVPELTPLARDGAVRARVEVAASALDRAAERIFRTVADAGIDLRELKRADASLEDVFARLTTHEADAAGHDQGAAS